MDIAGNDWEWARHSSASKPAREGFREQAHGAAGSELKQRRMAGTNWRKVLNRLIGRQANVYNGALVRIGWTKSTRLAPKGGATFVAQHSQAAV
jgi:hypothetical protein